MIAALLKSILRTLIAFIVMCVGSAVLLASYPWSWA